MDATASVMLQLVNYFTFLCVELFHHRPSQEQSPSCRYEGLGDNRLKVSQIVGSAEFKNSPES